MPDYFVTLAEPPDPEDAMRRLALVAAGPSVIWPASFPGEARVVLRATVAAPDVEAALTGARPLAEGVAERARRAALGERAARRERIATLQAMRAEALAAGRTQEATDLDAMLAELGA